MKEKLKLTTYALVSAWKEVQHCLSKEMNARVIPRLKHLAAKVLFEFLVQSQDRLARPATAATEGIEDVAQTLEDDLELADGSTGRESHEGGTSQDGVGGLWCRAGQQPLTGSRRKLSYRVVRRDGMAEELILFERDRDGRGGEEGAEHDGKAVSGSCC